MGRPMSCRLGWHKWRTRSTEDGGQFQQCTRCDKVNTDSKIPPGAGGF
ncbi:hypothetical protein [Paractinoplanes globisporus]|uniref:Uncharacterized protein n=1 Tax=Paractinoplanes globisporus TaxID=113565 RepID=A0ABW6WRN4_9ACTN|nr:hypothetical protein [Actinoplanes globisporus]